MKNRSVQGAVCALLCLALALCAAGCAKKQPVDLREKLTALAVTDEDLGIAGTYGALSDVEDG